MKTSMDMQSQIIARASEDDAFRASLLSDPKSAIEKELGLTIPDGYTIEVHEEDGTSSHLVLPPSGRLSETELAAVAGGNSWDTDNWDVSDDDGNPWTPD